MLTIHSCTNRTPNQSGFNDVTISKITTNKKEIISVCISESHIIRL